MSLLIDTLYNYSEISGNLFKLYKKLDLDKTKIFDFSNALTVCYLKQHLNISISPKYDPEIKCLKIKFSFEQKLTQPYNKK